MVKKIQINISDKGLYIFLAVVVIIALSWGIFAEGVPTADTLGHTADQVDLRGGVVGNAIFNDDVGVVGDISANDVFSTGDVHTQGRFIGDGSGLTDLKPRITSKGTCNSSNDGLLRYRSDQCSGDNQMSSYLDVCVRTGSGSTDYEWKIMDTNQWTVSACDLDGCDLGETYYQCDTPPGPGCYTSEPFDCYGFEFPTSFLAGTEILMSDGTYQNVEDVGAGEWVVSYDTENNVKTTSRVESPIAYKEVNGYIVINGELEVTSNHPMWIVNKQEWVEVGEIMIGDILLDSNEQEVVVSSLEYISGVNTVYNLKVEGEYNNYFAGDILVHNKPITA